MKKTTIILVIILLQGLIGKIYAQWREEGANLTNIDNPSTKLYGGIDAWTEPLSLVTFPINVVVMDDGSSWDMNGIKNALYAMVDKVNSAFSRANIRFLVYNKITKLNNQNTTFNSSQLSIKSTVLPNYNENAINVYIVKQNIYYDGRNIAGVAYCPWERGYRDVIVLDKDFIGQEDLLAHELGHLFGLYHTFNWINIPFFQGYSDDYIPDTDYDPNTSNPNLSCATPANYSNPLNNLMSYNLGCTARGFTLNQLELMREVATTTAAKYGRSDDFLGGDEDIDIDFTDYIDIPGNDKPKHIIQTSKNLTINNSLKLSKIIIQAESIVVKVGTLTGTFSMSGDRERFGGPRQRSSVRPKEPVDDRIRTVDKDNEYTIAPNPAKERFKIHTSDKELKLAKVIIKNLMGSIIIQEGATFNLGVSDDINIEQLASGIYLIELYDEDLHIITSVMLTMN